VFQGDSIEMSDKGYMPKSKSDVHLTPDITFDMIESRWGYTKEMMYDPCPADTPHKAPIFHNGLYLPYGKTNFVNPPYARKPKETHTELAKFVFKSIAETYLGKVTIMLLPAKTEQPWFHFLLVGGYDIMWIEKRITFKNDTDSSTQSHFLVMIR
jgi:hypothetical protein